jgi:hypothetical protein
MRRLHPMAACGHGAPAVLSLEPGIPQHPLHLQECPLSIPSLVSVVEPVTIWRSDLMAQFGDGGQTLMEP